MRKINKLISVICLLLVFLGSITVSAASGSSSMSVSSGQLSVGDTLSVTVSISTATATDAVQGVLSYNSSVLQCTSHGNTGSISIVLGDANSPAFTSNSVTFSFTAIAAGSSPLQFHSAVYTEADPPFGLVDITGCSTNVTVTAVETNTNTSEPVYENESTQTTESQSSAEEEKEPEEVEIFTTINGVKYKIWQDYEGVELPDGFGPYIFEYNNQQCEGAVDGSGRIRIAYLENTSTGEKGFYIYFNEQFMPFIHVNAVASSYVLYPLEEGITVPEIFDIKEDNFRGGTLPVWKSSDERLEGIILMYATAPNGDRGFYLYDESTATVQRFIQVNYEGVEEEEVIEEPKDQVADKAQGLYAKIIEDKEIFTIIAVLAALAFALLIACIFLFSVRRSKRANKEKFEKKMDRKKARFEKRANKYMSSNAPEQGEITIETENFDNLIDEDESNNE